jgi:hypothetical protein
MLQPAHVGHLALLRSLIRQGAADGSFDRDLAIDSAGAEEFFAKLKRALVTAISSRISAAASSPRCGSGLRVLGRRSHSGMPPVGFGLFRAIDGASYELWLAGLDLSARGGGQGRALLASLFPRRPAEDIIVACAPRLQLHQGPAKPARRIRIHSHRGFAHLRWFLHNDAPMRCHCGRAVRSARKTR